VNVGCSTVLLLALIACDNSSPEDLKVRAARDLGCPASAVTFGEFGENQKAAFGCNKCALYASTPGLSAAGYSRVTDPAALKSACAGVPAAP